MSDFIEKWVLLIDGCEHPYDTKEDAEYMKDFYLREQGERVKMYKKKFKRTVWEYGEQIE